MSRSLKSAALVLVLAVAGSMPASAGKLGLGTPATSEEVAGWDIDVRPDGQGLPEGRGTVAEGEAIFSEQCAACHGDFGEGAGRWPVLAGGAGSLSSHDPVKTIGSYWPYLSTVYDYVYRAMPFGNAQSLSPDETYAIVAYLLYLNDVVTDEEFELSKENFSSIKMPNEDGFIDDTRSEEPMKATAELCMTDCKTDVKITKRARIIDVTPEDEEAAGMSVD
ncbi:c-type cytochrome [Stappia indica]|uniref:c-type cytochrome n=1 Tax=Stappia indica TaxID=538381 RepID=UPI001D1956D0|nr:cytochrome c [Stappia indica]MCC4245616.1 cytochrome c [Stappia indica]